MVNYGIIKNEVLTNGGITLVNNKKMTFKNGYIVSKYGFEYITKDLNDAIKTLVKYGKENKIVGVWYNEGLYYVDVNLYFNKNERKKAFDVARINKQKALYNIHDAKSEEITQNYYILYKYNKIKNDFVYINEFLNIADIMQVLQVKKSVVYQNIYNSIDRVTSFINKGVNDYIIIKDVDTIEY